MKDRLPNVKLNCLVTVSIQNIYYIEELCNWINEQKFNFVYFGLVHMPRWLCVAEMTDVAKKINPDVIVICHGGPIAEPEAMRIGCLVY